MWPGSWYKNQSVNRLLQGWISFDLPRACWRPRNPAEGFASWIRVTLTLRLSAYDITQAANIKPIYVFVFIFCISRILIRCFDTVNERKRGNSSFYLAQEVHIRAKNIRSKILVMNGRKFGTRWYQYVEYVNIVLSVNQWYSNVTLYCIARSNIKQAKKQTFAQTELKVLMRCLSSAELRMTTWLGKVTITGGKSLGGNVDRGSL